MNVNTINTSSNDYPAKLRQLHKEPRQLYIKGDLPMGPSVAIIGSRKCSLYGQRTARSLARQLALWGVNIISGLALGIDGHAHRGALETGRTSAVLPGSVVEIYPASHRKLAEKILKNGGTLISEYPPGESIRRHSFIERNRIIAALSDVIVVVEAAERSGSLSTAQFALELGKPVLAVPGNIDSQTSRGTNRLIATGARALLEARDVVEEIGYDISSPLSPLRKGDNPDEQTIIDALAKGPVQLDEIQLHPQIEAGKLSSTLTSLELKGIIACQGGGYWHLR